MYEAYLCQLLEPLGVYNLSGDSINGAELHALGAVLDQTGERLETVEREAVTATAEGEGLCRLRVVFPRVSGVPAEFEQIRKIILEILPCHLDVEFYFRYLTWAECEGAGYTWAAVDKAEYTWEGFQLAVPPEE